MKLTIIRLQHFSDQDRLDLVKIWPQVDPDELEEKLDERHRLYAAKFNDRLLAAVKVTVTGKRGELEDFMVREVTRRRGVGSYLLEETLAQNPDVRHWSVTSSDGTDPQLVSTFMTAAGLVYQSEGWVAE